MTCNGDCSNCPMKSFCGSTDVPESMLKAIQKVKESLENVKYKILVLSGKGGVGKSTLTYMLTRRLSKDYSVGVLDLDLCGPSIPVLFNCENEKLHQTAFGYEPYIVQENISVVSTQFFLEKQDDPLIARGPKKNSLVLEFLSDINWDGVDLLLIDTPPGTSDEHLSIVSFMSGTGINGAIIITTPEEVSISDVRREIKFCQRSGIPILGVIENMSSFICPHCNQSSDIYPRTSGGAENLCKNENIKLLGKLPIDPSLVAGCDQDKNPLSQIVKDSISNISLLLFEQLNKN